MQADEQGRDSAPPLESSRKLLLLKNHWQELAFLFLLIAAAFLVRIWGLSLMHFWDENVYLQNAEVICCGKTNYSELSSRPPLLSILFAGAFKIWHHVYAASILTALLNALGPAFLYLSTRKLAGRINAAIAAMLLAFVPFFLGIFATTATGFVSDDTGNSLLSDSPSLTLLLLAFWLMLRALQKQNFLRFFLSGFALGLSVLMRFAALSTAGMIGLIAFGTERKFKSVLTTTLGFLTVMGPYLIWSRVAYGGFLATFLNGWDNFEGPGESPFYYLINFGHIFAWITLAGMLLYILERSLNLTPLQDAIAPSSSEFSPRARNLIESYLWFMAFIVLAFFSAMRHKEPRYAMPLAIPFYILAGIGLGAILRIRSRWPRIIGATLLFAALAFTFYPIHDRLSNPFFDRSTSEEMRVADFMTQNLPPNTIVYSNFNYPDFGYYSNFHIEVLPELGPDLYDSLKTIPTDGIFIAYRKTDDMPDSDPPLEMLDANPHFKRFKEFSTLVLYRYTVNLPK